MAESTPDVATVAEKIAAVKSEVGKVVVGQQEAIDQALIALLCEGHVLMEGVPGIAKTLIVRALAMSMSAEFSRVQFTPDLMPSDVIGTNVLDPSTGKFSLRKGPIFTNVLLADEINRTPPKTQAALLEAMQERRVTIDGEPYLLGEIFTVFATQNPIEYEGTYPLPEAQLDRFMFKVVVGYPSFETETEMLDRYNRGFRATRLEDTGLKPVIDVATILELRKIVSEVTVEKPVANYIARLVRRTRENPNLILGASPRASICLLLGSKALAAINGRKFVTPDDVKHLAKPVLRHRLILRPEAEIEGVTPDRVVESTLSEVEVPRE
ncbi:MAG: MoxR family ATPase [Armatimonadetes bacterium]|nr:MoxR family ATPase [Armatimonadota bacterium]